MAIAVHLSLVSRFVREGFKFPLKGSLTAASTVDRHSCCIGGDKVVIVMMIMLMMMVVAVVMIMVLAMMLGFKDHRVPAVSSSKHEESSPKIFKELQQHP